MIIPTHDDAPLAGEALVRTTDSPHNFTQIDQVSVFVLAAMLRFNAALCAARRLGPDLFYSGACREYAREVISGLPINPRVLLRADRAVLPDLRRQVRETSVPDDEAWALDLVRVLAEDRFCELLASMLEWAAQAVRERRPLAWVLKQLLRAFAIAQGDEPFDPREGWGGGT